MTHFQGSDCICGFQRPQRIHHEFYRLPEKTLQHTKISKVLMALEQRRLAEFHGKNLNKIGIDPDEKKNFWTVMKKTGVHRRKTIRLLLMRHQQKSHFLPPRRVKCCHHHHIRNANHCQMIEMPSRQCYEAFFQSTAHMRTSSIPVIQPLFTPMQISICCPNISSISLYSSFHHSKCSTNMFSSASLLLLAAASYVFCATELIQPYSVLIKTAEPLTITCTVSGASITDSSSHWGTGWIRQPAGKALEWINRIRYDGHIDAKDSLKSKFSISRDTSSNTVTLQGQNLQAEDTAVYYCARESH
ncbi:hypothetical protein MHYP_G00145980 [Metynnis hypsauchen]